MREKIIAKIKNINWFKVILYSSIVFLGVALYKADYIKIPLIHSYKSISFSFFFLFLGFVFMCHNWRVVLRMDNTLLISFKDAITSNGLSVFAKYIPGKLMVVIGRAAYISKKFNFPIKKLSFISLKVQIITLWVGLSIGLLSITKLNPSIEIILLMVFFIMFFTLFLFSGFFKRLAINLIKSFFKKEIDYPLLSFSTALKVLPSFILNWLSWCIAFYFLIDALSVYAVPFMAGTSFALAATLAILALIAPGGLGVREGILAAILIGFGINKTDAITISVASRLWFLIGEVFIFLLALYLENFTSNDLEK